jgi:hypothetical protein
MKAFILEMENRPGSLATAAEALADRGINIENIAGITCGSDGVIGVITNDEAGARSALTGGGITFREIELIPIALENRPGTLADAARRLADQGVNIELLLPTGMEGGKFALAFGVDNAEAARRALGELATVGR